MGGVKEYFVQVIPAIKRFCEDRLSDTVHMEYNPSLKNVYTETLRLIKNYEDRTDDKWWLDYNSLTELLEYVGKHIEYYWWN